MELEFRTKDGVHMVTFKGEFARNVFGMLHTVPEVTKGLRKLGNKTNGYAEYICFTCIKTMGYSFLRDSIEIVLNEGDYIKVK